MIINKFKISLAVVNKVVQIAFKKKNLYGGRIREVSYFWHRLIERNISVTGN